MVDAGDPMSVCKSKEVILQGIGSLTFGELSDVDTTNVVLKLKDLSIDEMVGA